MRLTLRRPAPARVAAADGSYSARHARSTRANAAAALGTLGLIAACASLQTTTFLPDFVVSGRPDEYVRVLELYPGVTATIVAPANFDPRERVELILYALPNGNSTAETIGRRLGEAAGWRFDIQHIGAQTRALRRRGLPQAVVAYLEADTRSWPEWRRVRGYERANARIVELVEAVRAALGNPSDIAVTLTGHSGGGSFAWGFIDAQPSLPDWLVRIALLDSNYSFEPRHGDRMVEWLQRDRGHTLVVLAYDDREITLDGRKVVSDSGGTWRATHRMLDHFARSFRLAQDTLGEFIRHHSPQVEVLLHPNRENRILHTELIGEMNGYMHALLARRPGYDEIVLGRPRAYLPFVDDDVVLPAAAPPSIPARRPDSPTGTAFIAAVAQLPREAREAAIRRELLAGNVPSFLRNLRTVRVTGTDSAGVQHTLRFQVMPDYLAIGSDEDFVRMPMNPYTAQAFCDAFGFVLPTRKLVDDVWRAAPVHLEPRPLTQERESPLTFLQHHQIIEGQLAGAGRGAWVAGIKKDVVVSNRLLERTGRVAIYGWHYLHGQPIQPVYAGHVDWYVDYSHGVRPLRRSMLVDDSPRTFEQILDDPKLLYLVSDEGPLHARRYDR